MTGGFANPGLVADSIVDLCGALGLAVAMVTLRRQRLTGGQIARDLAVSPATVSRVLSSPGKVAEATRAAVLEAVRATDFRRNRQAADDHGAAAEPVRQAARDTRDDEAEESGSDQRQDRDATCVEIGFRRIHEPQGAFDAACFIDELYRRLHGYDVGRHFGIRDDFGALEFPEQESGNLREAVFSGNGKVRYTVGIARPDHDRGLSIDNWLVSHDNSFRAIRPGAFNAPAGAEKLMGGVGFAPDRAGRVHRCPGALAPNKRTRATASKLKRGTV